MQVQRGLIDMPNVWFWCAFHLFVLICVSHSGHVLILSEFCLLMHCNLLDSHALQIKPSKFFQGGKSIFNSHTFLLRWKVWLWFISSSILSLLVRAKPMQCNRQQGVPAFTFAIWQRSKSCFRFNKAPQGWSHLFQTHIRWSKEISLWLLISDGSWSVSLTLTAVLFVGRTWCVSPGGGLSSWLWV